MASPRSQRSLEHAPGACRRWHWSAQPSPFTRCNSYPPDWELVCTDYPAGMIEGGYRSNAVAILGEVGLYDGTYATHRDGAFWAEYIAHHANAGPISAFPTWVAKKK